MKESVETLSTKRYWVAALVLLGGAALLHGWRTFWFLTDDAFIAFRYISNAHLGHGYVWNAPPFLPVEGYTSFLWIALLDFLWRVLGAEPPDSANWVSLIFSFLSLSLVVIMVARMRLRIDLEPCRPLFAGLAVLFLVCNRTYLAWSSSGLETAMMNFWLILWVYVVLYKGASHAWTGFAALVAALLALTRPDGLLFCAATVSIILLRAIFARSKGEQKLVLLWGLLPFGIVVAHLAWRLSFYGEWFPNTYYAKVDKIWPESGMRYTLSFIIEYALWTALPFVCVALAITCIRGLVRPTADADSDRFARIRTAFQQGYRPIIGTLAVIGHVGYYAYVVGGDHFEYRVYSYLLPLVFILLLWSLNVLQMTRRSSVCVLVLFVICSAPVPWTHWALTKDLDTREETYIMRVPIAPSWPSYARPYAQVFDSLQFWLIEHHVGMRHQEHKVFWETQLGRHVSRDEGQKISADDYPIHLVKGGFPTWVMPHVYMIDAWGLSDYVIARTPVPETRNRLMAHSRKPPPGYLKSFRANVVVRNKKIHFMGRSRPVTGEYIVENEQHWIEKLTAPSANAGQP